MWSQHQQDIAEGSSMYLEARRPRRWRSFCTGPSLCSGNDAALALADHCGGLERFVAEMNRKAAELGMTGAFANPNGLTQKGGHFILLWHGTWLSSGAFAP
ncbi:MAG: hypothetical protein ACLU38_09115 [Dysosmobacter sp.]